ncbi:MAG: 6-phosphogluconolactonase [Saprospiraceae bacterium]|nr:6-phosphogluconolactonase [Pyrinomonadaceae bacterium]
MNVRISDNPEELSTHAAEFFVESARKAIASNDRFTVALSGGSTPRLLHQKLVSAPLDWKKIVFFFGDERNVPPDHHESNFLMAFDTLFHPLNIDHANIYRWQTEIGNPLEVAIDYAFRTATFFEGFPRFDLIFLGLGTDGHTASLFPQTEALSETTDIAAANWVDKLGEDRFTLTFPVINNAENIAFLVSGKEKAAKLKDVIEGEFRPKHLPAQSVSPTNGTLHWFADKAAASLLVND